VRTLTLEEEKWLHKARGKKKRRKIFKEVWRTHTRHGSRKILASLKKVFCLLFICTTALYVRIVAT
jgi:hypothetical protein